MSYTRPDDAYWRWYNSKDDLPKSFFFVSEYSNELRPRFVLSLFLFAFLLIFLFNATVFFAEYGTPSERVYAQSQPYDPDIAMETFYAFSDQNERVPQFTVFLEDLAGVSTALSGTGMSSQSFDLWVERNMYSFYQWKNAEGFTFKEIIEGNFDFDFLGHSKQGVYYLCRPFIYTYYRITTFLDFASIGNFFDGLLALFGL